MITLKMFTFQPFTLSSCKILAWNYLLSEKPTLALWASPSGAKKLVVVKRK